MLSPEILTWRWLGLALVFAGVLGLEAIYPRRVRKADRRERVAFHVALLVFNSAVLAFFVAMLTLARARLPELGTLALLDRLALAPAARIVLVFLLLDLTAFGLHFAHHNVPWLWRFHCVHHYDDEVDVSTAFREHWIQVLVSGACISVVALVLGVTQLELALFASTLQAALLFQHANLSLPPRIERWLGFVLVTPAWHLPHHAPAAGFEGRNFGAVLSVWDRLLRTAAPTGRGEAIGLLGPGLDPPSLSLRALSWRPLASLAVLALFLGGCEKTPKAEPISKKLQVEIDYGRDLIARTAHYLGPQGTVAQLLGTRMSCQNCHLDAGAKAYGVNLATAFARYPDYRSREGTVLTLEDRVNTCVERPMSGVPIPKDSREMRAIVAYLRWLARGVPVGTRRHGDKLNEVLKLPETAASPERGRTLFGTHCVSCHQADGQGLASADKREFVYPPLWGPESYGKGSSLHRTIKLAAFIKANMPFGATWDKPILTDDEALDLAAFINDDGHPRPGSSGKDYPDPSEKPIDEAFGTHVGGFSAAERRLGPYPQMMQALRARGIPAYY